MFDTEMLAEEWQAAHRIQAHELVSAFLKKEAFGSGCRRFGTGMFTPFDAPGVREAMFAPSPLSRSPTPSTFV